jgi:hypothetical protein
MKTDEALNMIAQVVEQYKGTAHEHRLLNQALVTLNNAVNPVVERVKESKTRIEKP